MISQGLVLMAAGMGTVGLFLALLVFIMQATGAFFSKYAHLFDMHEDKKNRLERVAPDDTDAIAAAIAAITAHRTK